MDERVIALEEKVAYLEKALDELSAAAYDVSRLQERLERELRDLRRQAGPTDAARKPADEVPPHYGDVRYAHALDKLGALRAREFADYESLFEPSVIGQASEFHDPMNESTTITISGALASGSTTFHRKRRCPAPSICAAS